METTKDEDGTLSSGDLSYQNSPEMSRDALEGSDVTEAFSVLQDDNGPNPEKKISENEPEIANPEIESPEDVILDGGQATADKDGKKRKKKALLVDLDSDPDSDSSASFFDGLYLSTVMKREFPRRSSELILNAYKDRMKVKAERNKKKRNQGANLVEGLVDYMRVLEDRIDQLESGSGAKVNKADESSKALIKNDDSTIEIVVKFFNSAAYLEDDGSYEAANDETEKGSFMCGHDAQHLIRVLYSKAKSDGAKPRREADSEKPKADDIDILTFGVQSEAIAAFFAKQLDFFTEDDHLIRFGKPFRPLIRHLGSVREQLERLRRLYGQVMTEDIGKSDTAWESLSGTPVTPKNREESYSLPFATTQNTGDNYNLAYDQPAALPQFEAFLEFVDEFFGKQIQLYENLRKGKEPRIAFENLWMLFDANDIIYCPLREATTEEYTNVAGSDYTPVQRYTPQHYQVVATSGGLPLMRTMAPTYIMKNLDDDLSPVSLSKSLLNADVKTLTNILTQTAKISRRIRNNYTEFNVYCFYIDFNGVEFGTVQDVFVFKPYEREMDIRNLQAYPVQYGLQEKIYESGKSFLDATRISHLQYEGLTVGPNREEIDSPVVVDVKLAFEGGPDADKAFIDVPEFKSPASLWLSNAAGEIYDLYGKSTCSHKWCYSRDCTSNVYIRSQKMQQYSITSKIQTALEDYESEKQGKGNNGLEYVKDYMENNGIIRLLPGAVPGFALRNRKWVLLNLAQLKPVKQNDNWENLVLPPGHRRMVQAMVETHTQDLGPSGRTRIGMDLVQGKGRGCIILLHGVPGVGKTSTAECVAAHTKKPLYPITCGDIGIVPSDVERNMDNHFRLANRWGCVLLLDEADVFLAKRDLRDVQRNGLVSVFLRMLEYYSGILFLTTNRVGAIDDAFRSRLHLTLYYPKLTEKQTRKIFIHNFVRIADINKDRKGKELLEFDYKKSEKKIINWAIKTRESLEWNGRQIRNAFQTVLALSEFRAKTSSVESKSLTVTKKDFEIVANASIQFNEYLLATHGKDEDQIAGRESVRAQNFSPSSRMVKSFEQDDSDSSSEEEDSNDESEDDTDSDDGDEAKNKKSGKGKKEREVKSSSKKSKKTSNKNEKSDKKDKKEKQKKEKKMKEKDESDESDDSD
ncbi:hypothetical protein BGAL_0199g00140 [Botrytis galanthina]|uniref:AAA+ ATPase domain-containing protein n=1 Tax=Botrytis galanthina TaxID=278940 RepID=A0A4S8R072_9HELO|nr:hypothetical protein BGAL_0199g00140 [Botrytis galanthina]